MKIILSVAWTIAGLSVAPSTRAEDTNTGSPDAVASAHVLTLAEAVRAARAHQPALEMARGNLVTAVGLAEQSPGQRSYLSSMAAPPTRAPLPISFRNPAA